MAQERMAEATPSASSRSSGSPCSRVRLRRAYTDFGRWVRCAAGPKTLRPKTWLAGAVRSGDPSCPPFGLHCAAARLRWAVVDKLTTPWDVVGGFDRRRWCERCPCTGVEDLAEAVRPVGDVRGAKTAPRCILGSVCGPRLHLAPTELRNLRKTNTASRPSTTCFGSG